MRGATWLFLVSLAVAAVACGEEGGGSTPTVPFTSSISACGGFAGAGAGLPDGAGIGGAGGYCSAEVLVWSYDPAARTLSLSDNRMLLNCCGSHSVSVESHGGGYHVTQRDAPEMVDGSPARCSCMCVFDYAVIIEEVDPGMVSLVVERDVTDQDGGPTAIYSGSVDTAAGSGQIVLDETDVGPWCQEAATP